MTATTDWFAEGIVTSFSLPLTRSNTMPPPCNSAFPRQKHKMKLVCLLLAGGLHTGIANAAESAFELGEIRVVGNGSSDPALGEDQVSSVISQEEIRKYNRDNVGDAVNLLSGVNISTNTRNEKTVYLRGYDSRQAPLFIDGLPVYVPYDGYVDFARFTTADLAAIQVAKGFSSIVYGPNTLGGAINLVSRKPQSPLEGDVRIGFGTGNERQASANIGSRRGDWYFQAGTSYVDSGNFPLSSDFKATASENGGQRNNSYRSDQKISFKAGYTPNASDEYVVSYYKQEGEKGQPPSTYAASARYWRWPFWDKESINLSTKTAIGAKETLKLKWYLDKYGNGLNTYADGSYTTLSPNNVSGKSTYDDRTHGGSIELDSVRFSRQEVKMIVQYKVDSHISRDGANATTESFRDTLVYWGAEDNIQVTDKLLLSLGWANSELRPESIYKPGSPFSMPSRKSKANAQAGLFYDLSSTARLYATVAEKSRLPTLKDRYSSKWTTYIENPGLKPETAVNYEVGYQGTPWEGAKAEAALFYNEITDKIQTVYAPGTTSCGTTSATKCRMDNAGKVHVTGMELGLSSPVNHWLDMGGNYTYNKVENVSNPSTKITDIPLSKIFLNATAHLDGKTDVVTYIEAGGKRWASDTVRLSGYSTLNLKLVYRPLSAIVTEAGITNLTDRNYALADGFPNPGRMWFANARYQF